MHTLFKIHLQEYINIFTNVYKKHAIANAFLQMQ